MFRHILLAADGEDHSLLAIELCLKIAREFGSSVTAIHVLDPYLKQFYNEIYAQGRREYLRYVDACLVSCADELESSLVDIFQELPSFSFIRAYGDPEKEIIRHLHSGSYDLLITGGKVLSGIKRITSWNLPTRLEMKSPGIPVLVCRK